MSCLELENELVEAEDTLRASGYDLPLAWGLGFLIDNEDLLVSLLTPDYSEKALQIKNLCEEIRYGQNSN